MATGSATARLDGLAPYYTLAMPGPLAGSVLTLPVAGDGYGAQVMLAAPGGADGVPVTAYTSSGQPFAGMGNPYSAKLARGQALTGSPGSIFQGTLAGDGWIEARGTGKALAGSVLLVSQGGEIESVGGSQVISPLLVFTSVERDGAVGDGPAPGEPYRFRLGGPTGTAGSIGSAGGHRPTAHRAKGQAQSRARHTVSGD